MYKSFFIALLMSLTFVSCSDTEKTTECKDIACTKEFRTITLRFVDASGNPQIVMDFKVVNKRTGEIMNPANDFASPGLYIVASDSDLSKLSEKGDNVQVTATDPKTAAKIQVDYVISGGLCNCHIVKISGPDTVKI